MGEYVPVLINAYTQDGVSWRESSVAADASPRVGEFAIILLERLMTFIFFESTYKRVSWDVVELAQHR